ncbi:hypothetical protein [Microbacterium cremeum]|uniref:hypothetical protein n=1 Tax=Microbacterium cremeum TaxID=2782169 RepID=UPI001888602D|nr:hypothetical protein [Microbacterium cremeum]
MKTNPYAHAPFLCVVCEKEIAARRTHVVLTAISALKRASSEERAAKTGPMVCGRCREGAASHDAVYPDCDVDGCDLYEHGYMLGADRAAAAVWLVAHGKKRPTPATTTEEGK